MYVTLFSENLRQRTDEPDQEERNGRRAFRSLYNIDTSRAEQYSSAVWKSSETKEQKVHWRSGKHSRITLKRTQSVIIQKYYSIKDTDIIRKQQMYLQKVSVYKRTIMKNRQEWINDRWFKNNKNALKRYRELKNTKCLFKRSQKKQKRGKEKTKNEDSSKK